ncbi:hypothetical protein KR059_012093, partial [Drosophila kikkawai]
ISCTPLAKRNRDSPSPTGPEHPTKRLRAPQPQLVEMGTILEDLLMKVNEQKVRSINQGMKNAFARLKKLQEAFMRHPEVRTPLSRIEDSVDRGCQTAQICTPRSNKAAQTSPSRRVQPVKEGPGSDPKRPKARSAQPPNPRRMAEGNDGGDRKSPSAHPRRVRTGAGRRERPRRRGKDALIISPPPEMSYSEVLGLVTRANDAKMEEVSDSVSRVRKTAKGELLLEIKRNSEAKTSGIRDLIGKALGAGATIRTMTPQVSFRIWDLDELTTKEELANALVKQADLPPNSVTIKGIRALASGSQAATFTVPA